MTRIPVSERRERLVEAAIVVISRHGVAGASTRAIVAEAGMSLASLHYAFENQDALLLAVIEHVTGAEREAAEAALIAVPDDVADLDGAADPDRVADPDAAPTPGGSSNHAAPLNLEALVGATLRQFVLNIAADPTRELALAELRSWASRTGRTDLRSAQQEIAYEAARSLLDHATAVLGVRWNWPVGEVARLLVLATDGLTTAWLATHNTPAVLDLAGTAAAALARLGDAGPVRYTRSAR